MGGCRCHDHGRGEDEDERREVELAGRLEVTRVRGHVHLRSGRLEDRKLASDGRPEVVGQGIDERVIAAAS